MNHPPGMKVFSLLLFGQSISLLGSALTTFALGVWAYQKAGNVTDFSMIAVAATVPAALLSPLAGVVVDRWNRKAILLIGQCAAIALTALLAYLFWQSTLTVLHIVVISALAASSNAFVMPAITASVTLMVEDKDLPKANGAMTLALGLVRVIAPVTAGGLMLGVGIKAIFIIDLISFLVGIFALLLSPIPQPREEDKKAEDESSFLESLRFGWDYVLQKPGLLGLLLFIAAITFNISAITVLITPMVLGFTNAAGLGMIASISGCGLVVGSVIIMAWGGPRRTVFGVFAAALIICIAYILGPIKASFVPVAIGSVVIMIGFPIAAVCAQTLFQRKVAVEVQGRVFGLQSFITGISAPLALLAAGPLADHIFEPMMSSQGALAAVLGGLYGTGEGRGAAVLISLLGIICLLTLIMTVASRPIRRVDIDLPDVNLA